MNKFEYTPQEAVPLITEGIESLATLNHQGFKIDAAVVYTEDREHGIGPTYTISIDILYVLQNPHCKVDEFVAIFNDLIQDLRMTQAFLVRMIDVEKWYFIERSKLDTGDGHIVESGYCELTYTTATKTWEQKVAGERIPEPNVPDISKFE